MKLKNNDVVRLETHRGFIFMLFGACVLLCTGMKPAPVFAQTAPVSISVVNPDTAPAIKLINGSSVPITAALVTIDLTRNHTKPSRIYFDTVANNYGRDTNIVAGGSFSMPLPHRVGATLPTAVLEAVIFEDGTTWGAQPWVNDLLESRWIYWHEASEVQSLLLNFLKMPSNEALTLLRNSREARNGDEASAPVEIQRAYDRFFLFAMTNLDEHSRVYGNADQTNAMATRLIKVLDTWGGALEASKPALSWSTSPGATALDLNLESYNLDAGRGLRWQIAISSSCGGVGIVLAAYHPARRQEPPCSNPAADASTPGSPDSCGDVTWELKATDSGYNYDFGPGTAFGACMAEYLDCQGDYYQPDTVSGGETFYNSTVTLSSRSVFWNLDYWQYPDPASCESCANVPYPQGEQPVTAYDTPNESPTYWIDCD